MGLSILIPVYNQDISRLAKDLLNLAARTNDEFEILFLDDCSELSTSYLNRKVESLNNVQYKILSENVGRSAIRNKLIESAQFDQCIIMDCDMEVISEDFVSAYVKALKTSDVVVGGHVYQAESPSDKELMLHWKYGRETEIKSSVERNSNPYTSFQSGNFAFKKSIYHKIKFDVIFSGYGHEDTLFGQSLERSEIKILHIDNPLLHIGLDDKNTFLKKQKNAILNLNLLYKKKLLIKETKLIRFAKNPFIGLAAFLLQGWINRSLASDNPSIKALQMQKVRWFRGSLK